MPFVSRDELDRYAAREADMLDELNQWREMAPVLELARNIQEKIAHELGANALATTAEIGDRAYNRALEEHRDKAKDELVAHYEQENRRALYTKVLAQVESEEGPTILQDVLRRLETDPALAKKLRDSARKELKARADTKVGESVTEAQKEVIEAETERQIKLDYWDVQLALEHELDLTQLDLNNTLMPHDKLVIMFEEQQAGQTGVILNWEKDVHGKTGWVFSKVVEPSNNSYYRYLKADAKGIPVDRFVTIGSHLPDLENGTVAVRNNVLVARRPLVLGWRDDSGKKSQVVIDQLSKQSDYGGAERKAGLILGTDFQTRDLKFL